MFRPARKIAGGRRVRSAKIKTVSQQKEAALNTIIRSIRSSDLTHLILTVKIVPVPLSEPLICVPVRVIYFHESGAYLIECLVEIDKFSELEILPHRFQRRLINKFRDKKLIVNELGIHEIVLEMREDSITLSPTRLYFTENGFLCIGDHLDPNSIPICSCGRVYDGGFPVDGTCHHSPKVEEEPEEITDEIVPELVPSSGVDDNLVQLVMSQTKCSREQAVEALQRFNGDIVEAIMNL